MAISPPTPSRLGVVSPTAAVIWILGAVALLSSWTLLAPSAVDAAQPPFERSVYGTAAVTDTGERTDIRVTDGPGGLRLRTVLDAAKTYRLTVDGRSDADPINMRLSFDGELDYRASPQARDFVRIANTTSFEVLLYSDKPATYHLATIGLEECSDSCGSQAALRALVLHETPGLASALSAADPGRAADLLLQWAAVRVPMGTVPLDTRRLSAAEIYFDYFRPLERGVYCGGAADFLHKLLELFEIRSFTVDFGTTVDALTHVTVVVVDDRPQAVRWRIVDPSFAMTFGLSGVTGRVSLDQILEADRVGLSAQIEPTLGDLSNRTVILVRGLGQDPERVRCDQDRPFSVCSLAAYARAFDPLLIRNGFTAGLPGIFELFRQGQLYPTGVQSPPEDFVAMQERFRSAASRADITTALAELPLRPLLRRPAQLVGSALERDELTLADLDWHPRAPAEAVTVGWERCSADGDSCRDVGVRGSSYRLGAQDVGRRVRPVITATNRHGRTTPSAGATSDIVKAVPVAQSPRRIPSRADMPSASRRARLLPPGLSARTRRARTSGGGLHYTTAGRLTVPHGLSRGAACKGGSVSVRVTVGPKMLAHRVVRLTRDCTYRSGVVLRTSAQLKRRSLRFVARFTGNDVLRPRSARARVMPGRP